MGGSIGVKSLPGEGSSFILRLPQAIDPDTVRSEFDDDTSAGGIPPADRPLRRRQRDNVEVMRGILAQRPQVQMEVS